jgi:ABC-2 type transport system permease protein
MDRLASHLGFARALLAINLKASLEQRGTFAAQVCFMVLNNLTFFVFWWALMQRVPHLRGWRLGDIQLLFGLVAVAYGLAVTGAGGVQHLGAFIEEGQLDTLLAQPRPVLPYALGLRLQAAGIGDMISGVLFIATSGEVPLRAAPLVLLAAAAGALVLVATGVVFFSLAFWLGRVDALARQLWELLIVFTVYPEPLFGGALRLLLFTALPAGFIGYVPVHFVQEPSLAQAVTMLAAAAVYVTIAVTVFERGLARYSSGSRFASFG